MKASTVILFFVMSLGLTGCTTLYSPMYTSEVAISRPGEAGPEIISEEGVLVSEESYRDDSALIEDDIVKIGAALKPTKLLIGFINKTDQPLEILWSEATVNHQGITESFLLSYPKTETKKGGPGYHEVLPETEIIEPKGLVSRAPFPKSFRYSDRKRFFDIGFEDGMSRSERKNAVADAVGQLVEVVVPLRTPSGRRDYTINFTVSSAKVNSTTYFLNY